MMDYYRIIPITEPIAYLRTRLNEVSFELSMLDVVPIIQQHIEQHLMGYSAQPYNLTSNLVEHLPSDLLNEITEVTHDMIHQCFYRLCCGLDGDRVVGVNVIGDDAYLLIEPTEHLQQMINEYEDRMYY